MNNNNTNINTKIKPKSKNNRTKNNRIFKCIVDYKINQTGKILFTKEKFYKFKKFNRYIFRGKNDKGNFIMLSSNFIKRNFEEIIDKQQKKRINEFYFK